MRASGRLGGCLLAVVVIAAMGSAGSAAAAPTPSTAPGAAQSGQQVRGVTLVTGDRVTVAADGTGRMAVQPGEGREGMTFVSHKAGGRLQVIPSDAVALVVA